MHYSKDELTLLYDSTNARDQKTLAYARTLTNRINKQDLNSVDVSATLFRMIIEKLNGDVKLVINKSSSYYQQELKGREFSPKMWFLALKKTPSLLKAPIAFYKERVILCNTPTDIFKLQNKVAA